MTDCPGIEIAKTSPSGKAWYEVSHCPGCAERDQLREQLAQLRPYAQHTRACIQIREHAFEHSAVTVPLPCVCGLNDVYLADRPDAPVKEKP